MKTLVRCVLLAAGFGLVAAVSPASAQIYEELTFKTTFPFMVGRVTLPAGTYSVSPALDGNGALLEIRGDRHTALFLAEIWDASDREGTDMIPPPHGTSPEKNQQSRIEPLLTTHTARK